MPGRDVDGGGQAPVPNASAHVIASIAPNAPSVWPTWDFVLEIGASPTRSPKRDTITRRSIRSFAGVPVP